MRQLAAMPILLTEKLHIEYIPDLYNNQVTFSLTIALDFSRSLRYTYDQISYDLFKLIGHAVT